MTYVVAWLLMPGGNGTLRGVLSLSPQSGAQTVNSELLFPDTN